MSNAKHTPKRKRRVKAVPVLGAAGLLSLAGGASAATVSVADLPTQKTAPNHEIIKNGQTQQQAQAGRAGPTGAPTDEMGHRTRPADHRC
jgi:hypothetical protein